MKVKAYKRTFKEQPDSLGFSIEARTPADAETIDAFLNMRDDDHRLVITGTTWSSDGGRGFTFALVSLKEIEEMERFRKLIAQAEAELEAEATNG